VELGDVVPLPAAPCVVLDSNALDVLSNDPHLYRAAREAVKAGRLALLWTHVTIDELADIADCEKRGRLLLLGASLAWVVPTGSFVIGYSRLDAARLADEEDSMGFEEFRRGNLKQTADALIGATAVFEHAMLATRDDKLAKRAQERGVVVVDPTDLPAIAS
jgi:predicted nucleic acid-binding protein